MTKPQTEQKIEDNINPRKEYRLEHFVMSPVDAPADTPVIWVDHGLRVKGQTFISLAKISDLENLLTASNRELLERVLQMNGVHEGDWKEAIKAELRKLGKTPK